MDFVTIEESVRLGRYMNQGSDVDSGCCVSERGISDKGVLLLLLESRIQRQLIKASYHY